jgi:hypothetical protein
LNGKSDPAETAIDSVADARAAIQIAGLVVAANQAV